MSDNTRDLTDDELDAALWAAEEADTADDQEETVTDEGQEGEAQGDEDVEPPADGTDTEEAEQGDAEEAKADDWNPEGPGNVKAALKQTRDELKAVKAQLAEREAREREAYQRQQQQQEEAEYKRRLEEAAYDPDETNRLMTEFRSNAAARYQQQSAVDRVQLSEQYAREAFPDYDAQIARLRAEFGDGIVQIAMQQENPALWAYQRAKKIPDPESSQKTVQEEVAKQVAAALAKNNPPAKGPRSIGKVSSSGMTLETKTISQLSDAELERSMGLRK